MLYPLMKRGYRVERDSLGSKNIPSSAYYGVQTKRALDTFAVSGLHIQKQLIYALVTIKKAAALANMRDRKLDTSRGKAIVRACDEALRGKFDREFTLDVFQAGAGTSENMNVNEVLANRALQTLGKKKGDYSFLHPNDHVNMSQSTNDVFHSAIHIAAYSMIYDDLLPSLYHLVSALQMKARRWKHVTKSGRTHLRDAVPMTLGQEFHAYASIVHNDAHQLEIASRCLLDLNLGGTAIGTSINASLAYQRHVYKHLRLLTKFPFRRMSDLIAGTQSLSALATTSGGLKTLALDLVKIANDLRLLSSGPVTGLDELALPAVQPGSSIMPGKVNPAVVEMLDMVGFQVVGNDTTISLCAQAGQLELNVMMPLAAYNFLSSITLLSRGVEIFTEKCVKGIKANEKRCKEYVEKNPIMVTALTPYIGYAKAAKIAQHAYREGRTVRDLVLAEKLLDKKTVRRVLDVRRLTHHLSR